MEQISGTAIFVQRPRTASDLSTFHLLGAQHQFKVAKTIRLSKTDFENFVTDMLVDRTFIEESASLCSYGETWACLLIRTYKIKEGILVMPMNGAFVGWAAIYCM